MGRRVLLLTFQNASYLGKLFFQRWKIKFPRLETLLSNGGKFQSQGRDEEIPREGASRPKEGISVSLGVKLQFRRYETKWAHGETKFFSRGACG